VLIRVCVDDGLDRPNEPGQEPERNVPRARRDRESESRRMRECGSDVRELMHDGCPTACVDHAASGSVNAFEDHVNVCISALGTTCDSAQP